MPNEPHEPKEVKGLKLYICQGVSKEKGTLYTYLNLVFPNGYEKRIYPEQAEKFILDQLASSAA